MKNLSIGDQRLLQLADHLENGKLGHERFDFSRYNNEPNKCGTAGCALGECPVLWPEQWKWDGNDPLLRDKWETDESAHEFFGLDDFECDHLFYPAMQDTESFGGRDLDDFATKNEVAANIRAFVALRNDSITHF